MTTALGIDVGGSGIKGATVDLRSGQMLHERVRIPTPCPATPTAVIETIGEIVDQIAMQFGPCDNMGCAFPGVVRAGVVHNATNVDDSWVGVNGRDLLISRFGKKVCLINDADAAGLAEMQFGAGREFRQQGVVLMLTFGTGIGSALFVDGQLSPNLELGELELDGSIAEQRAASRFFEDGELTLAQWTKRVQRYLSHVDSLVWPDLIIFGGGISGESKKFLHELQTRAKLVPADFRGHAGIIGAALALEASALP
ncbi:MAG: ROK family protein [Planctomycetaceae bacterium]|nr:ROK family protein [Planctomycetaceae bacterium]